MKKLVSGIVVILVLAAAGYTGAAYWSGMQAQRWYEEALAEGAKNPSVKFSTVSYERGLFSSQSVSYTHLDVYKRQAYYFASRQQGAALDLSLIHI